jgi:hypothetical protein
MEESRPQGVTQFFVSERVEVRPEDFLLVKTAFPLLKSLDNSNSNFIKLVVHLKEMAKVNYDTAAKYQLMYKIVAVGSLLEDLFPNLKLKSPADKVQECKDGSAVKDLDAEQQFGLFQVARNCTADFSHIFYEKETRDLIENFSALCRGVCNSSFWVNLNSFGNRATDGKKLKTFFSEGDEKGRKRVNKLFCQMGYFLMKAKILLDKKDYDGACLALIAAGNCGRNFNRSTLKTVKVDSITAYLINIRTPLSHVFGQAYNEEKFIDTLVKMDILGYLAKLENEAKRIGNPIDLQSYYQKREKDESPRAYDASRFNI